MSAIILAGGQSRRMGNSKADLQLAGKSLLQHVAEALGESFGELLVVARDAPITMPRSARLVCDEKPGLGPLAGLYAGLQASKDERSIVVACDMPFLQKRLIERLLELAAGWDAVVPETADGLHPLCAVYSGTCLPAIESSLQSGKRRVAAFFPMVKLRIAGEADLRRYDPELLSLMNINTPEELAAAEERMKSSRVQGMRARGQVWK